MMILEHCNICMQICCLLSNTMLICFLLLQTKADAGGKKK